VSDAILKLYVNDTNLFLHDSDSTKLFSRVNICMSQLCDWFEVIKLSLNLDKTCYTIFGSTHKNMTAYTFYINDKGEGSLVNIIYLNYFIFWIFFL